MSVSPSSGSACRRKVETSTTLRPKRTWQSRKRRPTMKQFRKSFFTCWGWARGADVEVLRLAAEQQVAHAAAHQVGHEAVVLQAIEDLEGIGVDVLAGDGVLGPRQDAGRHVSGYGHFGTDRTRIIQDRPADAAGAPVRPPGRPPGSAPRAGTGPAPRTAAAGARGRARSASPSGAQGAHEQQLAPLQLGQREARPRSDPDVRERHPGRRPSLAPAAAILRAMCSSSAHLLRREVGALEERPPLLEVAVACWPRGSALDGRRPARSSASMRSFSSWVARRGAGPRGRPARKTS